MASSSTVSTGDVITAAQYNNLRTDALRRDGVWILVVSNDAPQALKDLADGDRVRLCDGTADDVQINAALQALIDDTGGTDHGGGVVFLSEGRFTLAASIVCPEGVTFTLRGSGRAENPRFLYRGTTIVNPLVDSSPTIDLSPAVQNNTHGATFEDFCIIATGTSGAGFSLVQADHIFIRNVDVLDHDGAGIEANECYIVVVENCYLDQNAGGGIYAHSGSTGVRVSETRFNSNTGGNIRVSSAAVTVINNYIEDESGAAHHLLLDDAGANVRFIGNEINSASTSNGIQATAFRNLEVVGNTFWNAGAHTIRIDADPTFGFNITGNIIHHSSNGGNAIRVAVAQSGTITGNTIDQAGLNGIYINFDAANLTITGNTIKNAGTAGTGDGIQNNGDGCTISGNAIFDNQATETMRYGINMPSGADNNVVTGNRLFGATTAQILNSGTGNIVRGNKGWVTENSGTGTINSGATTATVTHGLSVTPTVDDISISFGEQGTNDYGRWWISGISSTQFTLNVSADPGASNLDFGWRAVVL